MNVPLEAAALPPRRPANGGDGSSPVGFRSPAHRRAYWRVKRWLAECFPDGSWVTIGDSPQFEVRGLGGLVGRVAVVATLGGDALVVVRARLPAGVDLDPAGVRWLLERNRDVVRFGSFALDAAGHVLFQRAFSTHERGADARRALRQAVVEVLTVAETYAHELSARLRPRPRRHAVAAAPSAVGG
jgi:hypothetical protein